MSYWNGIARQAGREAVELIRWSSPTKIVLAVLPSAASGALTWQTTGQPAFGAAASVAAILLVGILWFGWKMLEIPARQDAELQKRLDVYKRDPAYLVEPVSVLKHDVPLHEALAFAVTGDWEVEPDYDGPHLPKLEKVTEDFMLLARAGLLRVWYKPFKNDMLWELLEPSAWSAHRIEFLDVARREPVLNRRRDGTALTTSHGLRACREQWTKQWAILREHHCEP